MSLFSGFEEWSSRVLLLCLFLSKFALASMEKPSWAEDYAGRSR